MALADAIVSKAVDMLISTISREIEQEIRLVVGADEQVQKLTSTLQSIQAVLIDAERRQLNEPTVKLWLDRLKEIAYDIDDVVDEWSYEMLRSQTKRDENFQEPTRKVRCLKSISCCSCFPKVAFRHRIAVKIDDLNQRLDVVAIEKDRYGFKMMAANDEHVQRATTSSIVDISEVKGREADKEKLVNLLLEHSKMSKLCLIPIVGMGGIGKSTLARVVYNDERVMSCFDKRIWVCVSDPFDEIRVAKEILESLQGNTPSLVSFSNIMEGIQHFVKDKTFLVVLDDVWNEDLSKWKQLEDCLKCGLPGSCVVVTTRNENVGRIMGCLEVDIFRVGLLSEEESWELFCMVAFSRRSSEERASLEEIGRQVVRRCKGLPLAVRAIAGLLQFKNSRIGWKSVLDSELWDLEEVQRDIIGPLWLSYYDLPSHLKQCFTFCATFPKDYQMEKVELIKHWVAQGYIQGTRSKHVEIVGDECFQNLVVRSLLQDVVIGRDSDGHFWTRCKMHDMVHDLAQFLVKKECLSIEVHDNVSGPISLDDLPSNLFRHLSVTFRDKIEFVGSFYNLKKLRSLSIVSLSNSYLYAIPVLSFCRIHAKSFGLDLQKIFNLFTCLRSLILSNCDLIEVPPNINRLHHLIELDVSDNLRLEELPNTIRELYNLQILNFRCTGMKSVKGIERLTNLWHLENLETPCFLPKEAVRLIGLRRLYSVNIDVDNEEAFSLKHLKNFNQLSGSLDITWLKPGDGNVEDARQACLQDKTNITRLQLQLDFEGLESVNRQHKELLEALNAPPNLEFLRIYSYLGLRAPSWLGSLAFVKVVELRYWALCELLPPLGKLPCLQDLQLRDFREVRTVGAEFLGMDEMISTTVPLFPKLTSLALWNFYNWSKWENVDIDGAEETLIMPSLTYLEIKRCQRLNALPNFILKKTALNQFVRTFDAS